MTRHAPDPEVIDDLAVLICGLDERGTILEFNQPCEQLTGVARAVAVGRSWLELFAVDERQAQVRALWTQARAGHPSGPYEAPFGDQRSLRWQFARPVADARVTLWAVGFDMTAEREALTRAREVERTVAFDNLVSGLTHELRNPLNSALLQLELAERREARHHTVATSTGEAIGVATSELRRMSALLDDFVVFVRPERIRRVRVDLRTLVERALVRGRARALAAGVTLVLEAGNDASAVVDPQRIETAVYHLLANAVDAASVADVRDVHVRLDVQGNAVAIEVEDHGPGLPAQAPIFDAFFTTKLGEAGLGLTIVTRAAIDHGGTISHVRRADATVFRLVLPIAGGASN